MGWSPGRRWAVGEAIFIHRRDKAAASPSASAPLLWKGGIKGGQARIIMWKKCGGRGSWHPDKSRYILERVPWRVEEEDASILLLQEDGSRGLDLSFVTHIYLLERIKDPALQNQIISRAHRMGATGPVHVILLQVVSKEDESHEGREINVPTELSV